MDPTEDPTLIKSAYRKRMKELHPDSSGKGDSFDRHALLVQVNQAYKRLIGEEINTRRSTRDYLNPKEANELTLHSDPAYVFYKAGLGFFMKIHPSQWDFEKSGMLNIKISENDAEQQIMLHKIRDLVKLFPKAYYYLNIVVNEYPESIWARDARDKMNLIEERTRRYQKIMDSFSTWNVDRKKKKREYLELWEKHEKNWKAIAPETEKRWKGGNF